MKSRTKRIRKRPRSELHSNDDIKIETTVTPLSINGKKIGDAPLIRFVKPYPYTFASFCKARWIGRTVFDVYTNEFGSYPPSYYEAAIRQGRILVSDKKIDSSYEIQAQDVLTHTVHRHEPAVAVASVDPPHVNVVAETDKIVAFDKPATLPVHPCGGYHENSLMKILEDNSTYGKLFTIHRIDRLTSGLVCLAKTSAAAKEWGQAIQQHDCSKVYLARVKGRFGANFPGNIPRLNRTPVYGEWTPDETTGDTTCQQGSIGARSRNAHGFWLTKADLMDETTSKDTYSNTQHALEDCMQSISGKDEAPASDILWLNFACPVRIEKPKIGVCASGVFADLDDVTYTKTVKAAQTSFAIVRYSESDDSTLLMVRPATGRTHQIRIHLQYLGHCIANDPNYGGSLWFGNEAGEIACEKAQSMLNAGKVGDDASLVTTDVPATETEVRLMNAKCEDDQESLEAVVKRTCVWCARLKGKGAHERAHLEFLVRSPGLWLHAFQYTVNGHSFRTDLPTWSKVSNGP